MDDANVPSLLSLAYFGFVGVDDHLYQNTRKLILNQETNPFYFKGKAG
jgi:meiotically up-regulated gene 157 (Mug157) protein